MMLKRTRALAMGDCGPLAAALLDRFGRDAKLLGCEVGVHRGATSAGLLRTFPQLSLVMVDSWCAHPAGSLYRKSGDACARLSQAAQEANCQAAANATRFATERRTMLRETSEFVATHRYSGWQNTFDFVLIDGDHTLPAVRTDLRCWWPLVRAGGLVGGHDIDHPRDLRGLWGVRRAVEEHMRRYGLQLITEGHCWWMHKP